MGAARGARVVHDDLPVCRADFRMAGHAKHHQKVSIGRFDIHLSGAAEVNRANAESACG
jgi:hypothetical protein